jgi:hypothetical protein
MGARNAAYRRDAEREAFLRDLNGALRDFTPLGWQPPPQSSALPIIYIVGAQRSGTTLLSQLISRMFRVGYVNNMVAAFWDKPLAGILLSKTLLGDRAREAITFRSKHGVTPAIEDPHEFGYFWRRWLPVDQHPTHSLPPEDRAAFDVTGLKTVLEEEMLGGFNLPLVFKNVLCGFHPDLLVRTHSRSIFINILRNQVDTCASVLRTRFERFGSYGAWWSLKPPTYPGFLNPTDPAAEVFAQITDCRTEIELQLARSGAHAIDVSYEALCADPQGMLAWIAQEVRDRLGHELEPVAGPWPLLRGAGGQALPAELAHRLRELAAR